MHITISNHIQALINKHNIDKTTLTYKCNIKYKQYEHYKDKHYKFIEVQINTQNQTLTKHFIYMHKKFQISKHTHKFKFNGLSKSTLNTQ